MTIDRNIHCRALISGVFLAAVLIGASTGLGAQEGAVEAPAASPLAPAAAARKPKPKPKVKQAGLSAAPALRESSADAEPGKGARHICFIDRATVDQQAAVSVASNKRLAELRAGAQAQVDGERRRLEALSQSADGEIKLHPTDDALKKKRQGLNLQMQALANQAGLYSRADEAKRQGVNGQLQAATIPVVQGVVSSNACSVVLSKDALVDPVDAVDISKAVVDAMNAKLQYTPFNLVDLTR